MSETIDAAAAPLVQGRIKLKNHVYFGMVDDGVLFDAGDASFVVKDIKAYPLVARLIALIDDGHPVERILDHAPARLGDFFSKVLGLLEGHGMLLAVEDEAPPAAQLVAHSAANELRKFLEDRLEGRAVDAALRRWRAARITVCGSGHAMLAALRALADSGCASLRVVAEGRTAGLDRLCEEIEAAHGLRVVVARAFDEVDVGVELLLYASDAAALSTCERVERALRDGGATGAIGAVFAGRACVLPAAQAGHPGLDDLLHWLPPQDEDVASLGPVALSLLGCVAAQAAICRFFAVESGSTRGQVAVVAPSLEVGYHMLVAGAVHAAPALAYPYPPKYDTPEWRPWMPFEQARHLLEAWFDPLLGPFAVAADDDIEQVPLLLYPLRVRRAGLGGDAIVIGWGLEHALAVMQGLCRAVEALAQSFAGDDVVLVCEFDEALWRRRALACAVSRSAAMARRHRWAWVDPASLPPGPARVLHTLLRFHLPAGVRLQLQWSEEGDAFIGRVAGIGDQDAPLACVVAADPLSALTEALGQACAIFQVRQLPAARFTCRPNLPAPDPAYYCDNWQQALAAARDARPHAADFIPAAGPGFPPGVYCGHASLSDDAEIA